jgi:DHA2 family multidrug resistance protein-like MFS transporter
MVMAFLQVTMTIATLGEVQQDLAVPLDTLPWIPSAYSLAVAACVLASSAVAERLGRRRVLLVGLGTLMVGGLILYAATSFAIVVIGQAVSGIGGALVLPSSLALITQAFTEPAARATAITIWGGASGLGLGTGPLIAGWILENATWNLAFLVNPIVGAFALFAALRYVQESRSPGRSMDIRGAVFSVVAIGACVYAISEGGRTSYSQWGVMAPLVVGLGLLSLLVVTQLRVAHPVLEVRLFRRPSYVVALLLCGVVLFSFVGISLLQVVWLQRVGGLSVLQLGLQMTAEFGAFIVASAVAGPLVQRFGPAVPIVLGLFAASVGAFQFSLIGPQDTFTDYAGAMILFGAGAGLANGPTTALAINSVPSAFAAAVSGTSNAARQIGAALGTSVLGAMLASRLSEALPRYSRAADLPPSAAAKLAEAVLDGRPVSALPSGASDVAAAALTEAVGKAAAAGAWITGGAALAALALALTSVRSRR